MKASRRRPSLKAAMNSSREISPSPLVSTVRTGRGEGEGEGEGVGGFGEVEKGEGGRRGREYEDEHEREREDEKEEENGSPPLHYLHLPIHATH